jgi:flap endonuclease-1
MGIANMNVFLRKHCPEIFETIHISEYAFKKLAIDTSLFLCKFKCIAGDRWLELFIKLVSCLRRNEIHCVFIYDSGSPEEKAEERAERRRQQEKTRQKVIELEKSLERYYETGVLEQNLLDIYSKAKDKPTKRLLRKTDKEIIDIDVIKSRIDKMRSNILNISQDDFYLTKDLFKILNIPYYDAPMEAETCCSDLCIRGIVEGVLSEDTDVLAYGTPVFLTKIDTKNDTCVRLHHSEILSSLDISKDQFLDLAIMFGCDYNKNIPKVGVETSFKYIKKYGSIDDIADNLDIDVSVLNHNRTRQLFTEYEEIKLDSVPYCGVPDFNALEKFIEENNLNINIEKLKKDFTHNMVFIEDEEELEQKEEDKEEDNEEDEIEFEILEDDE